LKIAIEHRRTEVYRNRNAETKQGFLCFLSAQLYIPF
jgi:hypothetical protein